jgi:hypothetical protein
LQFYPEKGGNTMRLVAISDTHGLDDRIEAYLSGRSWFMLATLRTPGTTYRRSCHSIADSASRDGSTG